MKSTNYYILNIISSEDFRYSVIICEEELESSSFQYELYSCIGNIKKKVSLNAVIEFIKNKIPSDTITNQPKLTLTNSSDICHLILLVVSKYSIRQVK